MIKETAFDRFRHRLWTALGAIGMSLVFFLVLPLMQSITAPREGDVTLTEVAGTVEPPPPPPTEPEPEEEQDEEPPPPALAEEAPPLDLSQMEIALNPGGGGWMGGGDYAVSLNTFASKAEDLDSVFDMADLDQKPRPIYQASPKMTKQLRRKTPATVYVICIVDERGRVQTPKVQKSTDTTFNQAAMAAIKQWKFEPGKRSGKPVSSRVRIPMTFPKG
jgi:protein TonB